MNSTFIVPLLKKSITVMAEKFAECALHHWPMLCIPDLPPYMASSTSDWAQSRKKMLADCAALKCFAQNPGVLAYEPFDVRELIVLGGGV